MSVFFAIVFIAELIIASHIITFFVKCDKRICEINSQFNLIQPQIPKAFLPLRIGLNTALLNINKASIKLAEKKNEYKTKILKTLITSALFLALNINGKRAIAIAELLISIKDVINGLRKFGR